MTNRTVYLVRHGQRLDTIDKHWHTLNNDNKYDPPLSDLGVEQAKKLGVRLAHEPIDWVISSPYLRALQTAHYIAEITGHRYLVDEGVGEWQGRSMMPKPPNITPYHQRADQFPYMDLSHETQVVPQHPETVQEVFERYRRAMMRLLDQYEGNLLIVGHGRVVTGISHVLTGKREGHFKFALACLTTLHYDGSSWDDDLNSDISHLTSLPETYYV